MSTPVVSPTLNRYAKGLFANSSNAVADFLAPRVTTGAAQFYVNDYGQRSSFQVPNAIRAIGGDSTAVLTDGDRVEITLKPHALHDIIDNHELDLAGDEGGRALLREARVRNIINQGDNARLSETLTVARAAVSATAQVWGASDDPVADIDAEMETIANTIGMLPNRVLFSLGAWQIFKNAAAVKARLTAGNTKTKTAAVMLEDAASLLLNPNSQAMLSTAVFDSKLSATSSKANALSNEVWIFYAAESADMFDPSAFKTFSVRDNPFDRVRTVQKDFGEKPIVEWTQDAYANNASAAARLTVTTS